MKLYFYAALQKIYKSTQGLSIIPGATSDSITLRGPEESVTNMQKFISTYMDIDAKKEQSLKLLSAIRTMPVPFPDALGSIHISLIDALKDDLKVGMVQQKDSEFPRMLVNSDKEMEIEQEKFDSLTIKH